MKFIRFALCLGGSLAATLLAQDSPIQPVDGVRIDISLSSLSVCQFEPVWIIVKFHNTLGDPVQIDLGPKREGNIEVYASSETGALTPIPVRTSGFGPMREVELGASAAYEQRMLLYERFPKLPPGSYSIRVVFRGTIQSDSSHTVVASERSFALEVRAAEIDRLARICAELASTVATTDSAEEAIRAATALSYVTHPVSIRYLAALLTKNPIVIPQVTAGLERLGNQEAVAALLPYLASENRRLAGFTRGALMSIKANTSSGALREQIEAAVSNAPPWVEP